MDQIRAAVCAVMPMSSFTLSFNFGPECKICRSSQPWPWATLPRGVSCTVIIVIMEVSALPRSMPHFLLHLLQDKFGDKDKVRLFNRNTSHQNSLVSFQSKFKFSQN